MNSPVVKSSKFHPFTLCLTLYQYRIIVKLSMNTRYPPTYLKVTLEQGPLSTNIAADLGYNFQVISSTGRPYDHTPLGGNVTCAKPNNWMDFLRYLTGILDCQVRGYKSIWLFCLIDLPRAFLLHSLFCICARFFWSLYLGYPWSSSFVGTPKYSHMTPLHLDCNSFFVRISQEEFEDCTTGL